ncbi:MAG: STT3 domain-containing protein [Methanobacteriaceae archaeon]|nr:STT3 domain-containing protein [Methanobacteriaceae archaeon]
MEYKKLAVKVAPILIVLALLLTMFAIRAETSTLGGVPADMKDQYRDSDGLPYFTEMDSYYNYRLTENYLNNGHLGDKIVNGEEWDSLSTSPDGRSANYQPVIAMLTTAVYNFLNIFTSISLMEVAFWMSSIIAPLAVIPAFFIVRRVTGNNWGAVVAAVIATAAPAYFTHTYAGFFDTDMFNVLLPLMVALFLTESIYSKNNILKAVLAALSALTLAIFSLSWVGYGYMLLLAVGSLVIYIILSFILDKKVYLKEDMPNVKEWIKTNPATIPLISFVVLALISLYITTNGDLIGIITGIIGSSSFQASTITSAYPNVYVSVGEMQIPAAIDVATNSGGVMAIVFAFLGLVTMGVMLKKTKFKTEEETEKVVEESSIREIKKSRTKKYTPKTKKAEEIIEDKKEFKPQEYLWTKDENKNMMFLFVLLSLWTLGLLFALTQGTRFIEQFEVPMALSAGVFVGLIVNYLKTKMESKNYILIIAVILLLIVAVKPIVDDYSTATQSAAGTNDAMVDTLKWVNGNTPQNTVLASWWDFGHLFAAMSDRQVVFDGGSQNSPTAYWIGHSLETSDQNLSAGILRMLANSGTKASDTLDVYTQDTGKSVEILNKILPLDKAAANSELTGTYGLTQEQSNSVLDQTHPQETKPVNLILSSDMLSKAAWWAYFGTWDFKNQNATHISYYPDQSTTEQINGKQFFLGLENGVVGLENTGNVTNGSSMSYGYVNLEKLNKSSFNQSTADDKVSIANELDKGTGNLVLEPHKLIVIENNQLTERIVNENSNMTLMVIKQTDGSYFTVLMNRELEDSMFTKLYLKSGMNVTRFNMTHSEPGVSVWNVQEYSGNTTNLLSAVNLATKDT